MKIGKITLNGRSGNIYLANYAIEHVAKKYAKELEQIGISAESYVKLIIREYTEVREAKTNSKNRYLLVVSKHLSNVAIVDFIYKDGEYQVVTAYPIKMDKIKDLKIVKHKK